MTPNARLWLAFYCKPFRDATLFAYARRCRAGRLDSVYNPLFDLAASADGLTGPELELYAANCCHQADVLYRDAHGLKMYAMEFLCEWDLARLHGTAEAFVQAVAEVIEAELARRENPLGQKPSVN